MYSGYTSGYVTEMPRPRGDRAARDHSARITERVSDRKAIRARAQAEAEFRRSNPIPVGLLGFIGETPLCGMLNATAIRWNAEAREISLRAR